MDDPRAQLADERLHREAKTGGGAMSDRLNRREALKVLGAVPVAAAMGPAVAHAESATEAMQASVAQATAPKFFNAHEWRTLRVLVDYIIPSDEHSGSATDAKVPEYIDFLL